MNTRHKSAAISHNKEAKNALIYSLLILLPSQLSLNRPWGLLLPLGVGIYLAFLILRMPNYKIPLLKKTSLIFWSLVTLLSSAIISSVINFWLQPTMVATGLLVVVFGTLNLVRNVTDAKMFLRVLTLTMATSLLLICLLSFWLAGVVTYKYAGIFNNPNNMGWFASSGAALLLGALFENRLDWKITEKYFLLLALGVSTASLVLSTSRASIFGLLFAFGVLNGARILNAISFSRLSLKTKTFKDFLLLLALSIAVFIMLYQVGFFDNLISKFTSTIRRGNISNYRFDAWAVAFSNWTFFGLGADYKAALSVGAPITGHNTFVNQMSQYGILFSISFFLILCTFLRESIRALQFRCFLASAPLLTVTSAFLFTATFEAGASAPGFWMAVVLFCILKLEMTIKVESQRFGKKIKIRGD